MTTILRRKLKQLQSECEKVYDWMTVHDFCEQAYGFGIKKVILDTYGEYNDEGGTDYRISAIHCYKAQEEECAFDLSLPFWQQLSFNDRCFHHLHADYATANEEEKQDAALEALKDFCYGDDREREFFEKQNWVEWESLPCDRHYGTQEEYDLEKMPSITS